jgi:hypothetical protein
MRAESGKLKTEMPHENINGGVRLTPNGRVRPHARPPANLQTVMPFAKVNLSRWLVFS